MQNNPKFMSGGRKGLSGINSSHTNTLEGTMQKFNYGPGDEAGRGSFGN